MKVRFSLTSHFGTTTPTDGETLGEHLAKLADTRAERLTEGFQPHTRRLVTDLYCLAADAFDSAAAVTLGHGRASQYENQARILRKKAEEVMAREPA